MWLLGSSMYSAHLAAAKGLPYVFAHHFSGQGTAEALAVYRSEFQPSELTAEPVTFLTVNAAVADTAEEAAALMLPNLQLMARLRRVSRSRRSTWSRTRRSKTMHPQQQALVDAGLPEPVVGTASRRGGADPQARRRVRRRRGHGQPGGVGPAWHGSAYGTRPRAHARAARRRAALDSIVMPAAANSARTFGRLSATRRR